MQQEKLLVAVMDLRAINIDPGDAEAISDRLRFSLTQAGVFHVLERAQMTEIMNEQNFQISGACDTDECVVQVGMIIGAKKIVAGSISKVGTVYSINVRIVDIQTSTVDVWVNRDVNGIERLFTEATEEVARELSNLSTNIRGQLEPETVEPAVTENPTELGLLQPDFSPYIDTDFPYSDIGVFSDGFAPVKLDDSWGFIDTTGVMVIPAGFDSVGFFSCGYAPVMVNSFWGYIDTSGMYAAQPQYIDAGEFSHNIAVIGDGTLHGIINTEFKLVSSVIFEVAGPIVGEPLPVKSLARWGYLNFDGSFSTIPRESERQRYFFSTGDYAVIQGSKMNVFDKNDEMIGRIGLNDDKNNVFSSEVIKVKRLNTWGLYNIIGRWLTDPIYAEIIESPDTETAVPYLVCEGRKWGFLDARGHTVISSRYQSAHPFINGYAAVELQDGQWVMIDESGEAVLGPYSYLGDYSYSLISAQPQWELEGRIGYMNLLGEFLIDPQFDYADNFNSHGQAIVGTRDAGEEMKYGIIETSGALIIEPVFDNIEPYWIQSTMNYKVGMRDSAGIVFYALIDNTGNFLK
ncbi:WG repeat-containing protein [Gemmatimonadota bacterium]